MEALVAAAQDVVDVHAQNPLDVEGPVVSLGAWEEDEGREELVLHEAGVQHGLAKARPPQARGVGETVDPRFNRSRLPGATPGSRG